MLDPITTGTLAANAEDGSERALLMTVAVATAEVPGLAEAFEQHRSGHRFDVRSRWSVVTPPDVNESPKAYLDIELQDVPLRFVVRFVVDDYKRSLATAAQTGRVELWEPAMEQAMKVSQPEDAYAAHGAIGLTTGETEVLRQVLQQRFTLPLRRRAEPPQVIENAGVEEALERFLAGARQPELIGIAVSPGLVVVIVVDPAASQLLEGAGPEDERWGHWASVRLGPLTIARVTLLTGKATRLASWQVVNPAPELIRATGSGPHVVVALDAPLPDDPEQAAEILRTAVAFPVREAPEAMRVLRQSLIDLT